MAVTAPSVTRRFAPATAAKSGGEPKSRLYTLLLCLAGLVV